jgi:hypothetical protein
MGNYTQETAPTRLTKAKSTSLAREILTSNFWKSGLAMLNYIPRSFRVKQVDGMGSIPTQNTMSFGTGSSEQRLQTHANGER